MPEKGQNQNSAILSLAKEPEKGHNQNSEILSPNKQPEKGLTKTVKFFPWPGLCLQQDTTIKIKKAAQGRLSK